MKKQLNATTIMNELRGNSAFFPQSATSQPPAQQESEPPAVSVSERPDNRSESRSEWRTDRLPVKRHTKRYSFELYHDQIMTLKTLKRQAEDCGEVLTLSDMVRTALDLYLNQMKVRSEERSR